MSSSAGIATAPGARLPPEDALEPSWGGGGGGGGPSLGPNPFFSAACRRSPSAGPQQGRPRDPGSVSGPDPGERPAEDAWALPACPHLLRPPDQEPASDRRMEPLAAAAAAILLGFSQLSASDETHPHAPPLKGGPLPAASPSERSIRPLPPLPPAEEEEDQDRLAHRNQEEEEEEADREVEFLTSSDTDRLLGNSSPSTFAASAQGQHGFRGCGQVNYAYFEATADEMSPGDSAKAGPSLPSAPPPPPPHRLHRRLRRSHSGPAGSFHKPNIVVRVSNQFRQVSPTSDDDAKPEVPPRAPIPARALKPDYRRWSAEVASGAYSDEDKPPKVPPREPLFRGDSRTPSPKSLPSYLHGVMPPTQSFAPDPKYVSTKALQRQQSEGATPRGPCILPIIEKGRKVSSTHYYLLPERPPYLDRYEKFFQEANEADPTGDIEPGRDGQPWREREADPVRLAPALRAELGAPIKRKHFPCVVSP
ncbi:ERBB receptor feedback inhibitor 1 [Sceloporus undulatus]|uniref:ERBB receptor feedback inhibitor 1 n=1 Tax=Sceloporus undulatus TaxID=8520 RepID=UPI001C4B729F|nr:ERBB receptor feedback inhibitor 1 [Sceloporus undulatus]